MIGEATNVSPVLMLHAATGILAGADPTVAPVCFALPRAIANGGGPVGVAGAASGVWSTGGATTTGCAGSTQLPAWQIRDPLQSTSFAQPLSCCVPGPGQLVPTSTTATSPTAPP